MVQRNIGLMGQYAGFVTRAVAIIIDILIVIVAVLVLTASISLPLNFFLNINASTCSAVDAGASSDWGGLRILLCVGLQWLSVAIALLTGPIYFIFLVTSGGQTIGKYVMGVRVVRLDGKPMTYVGGALRWFGYLVSLLPLGLGFFWAIVDDRRRTFHDKMAGTCVIYSWRAQQNELLLTRIHRFFRRNSLKSRAALMHELEMQDVELVTLAVPSFNDLNTLLRTVNESSQNKAFGILALQELAKSSDGQVSQLDVDPMFDGVTSGAEFSKYSGMTPERLKQVRDELPNDHFALAVLITEENADQLVKVVARRTPAQIRRYVLRETAPGAAKRADIVAQTSAAAIESTNATAVPAVESRTAPAAPATAARITVSGSAIPAPAIPAPTVSAANGGANDSQLAERLPELLAAIDELKQQQAALQATIETRTEAILASEASLAAASLSLAAAPTAAPEAAPASVVEPMPAWETRYPALTKLGAKLAALPEAKTAAIDAAVAASVMPQIVADPQDLTAIRGIGPTFEQRLYCAGVGASWEVATFADDELCRILALSDLQLKTVDLAAIRADARRLAEETGTVGFLWQGQTPDDFEPIEGIGPVFEQRLYEAGIRTYGALASATPVQLAEIVAAPKPSQPDYAGWIEQARRLSQRQSTT